MPDLPKDKEIGNILKVMSLQTPFCQSNGTEGGTSQQKGALPVNPGEQTQL